MLDIYPYHYNTSKPFENSFHKTNNKEKHIMQNCKLTI